MGICAILLSAPASIALGGHTDPVGPDDYNMSLSVARAEKVKAFIKNAGFTGEVLISGYGETKLPPAPPGITPDSPEHHRLARRVAFKSE